MRQLTHSNLPYKTSPRGEVSPKVTEGGLLIGWAGGQPYLPLPLGEVSCVSKTERASFPLGEGVTAGDGWGVLPLQGKVSCVSKTDGVVLLLKLSFN